MTSTNDITTFPIDHLPRDVLLIILKKVEWKDIYNIRLTTKYLNFFVKENYEYLPKVGVIEIKIKSCYRDYQNIIRVDFSCICINKSIKIIEDIVLQNNNEEIRFPKIERYLREVDLSVIPVLELGTINDTTAFDIFSRYFKIGGVIRNLTISTNKCPSFLTFSNFIQKLKFVEFLTISKLCFPGQTVPLDYTLSMINGLISLNLTECECTHFVNQRMILDLFNKNENLKDLCILSKCVDFKDELIEKIKEREVFCDGNEGYHNKFVLCLPKSGNTDFDSDHRKYFLNDFNEIHSRKGAFNDILCFSRYCDLCISHSTITLSYMKHSDFYNPSCDSLI